MITIGKATLHNMDCMEYMKELPDNYFDLAIVDPPYGIDMANKLSNGWVSRSGGIKHDAKDWDKNIPNENYWNELFRVSKNQIAWGGNYFIQQIKKNHACWIFWDKNNGDSLFADGELAWTSFDTPLRKVKIHWCGSAAKHETGFNKIHPTQKPVKLYEWLLTNYAKQGDKILDTHLGSGSHAIACNNLGFEMVGCELDTDYFEAACKRIKSEAAQERLFA